MDEKTCDNKYIEYFNKFIHQLNIFFSNNSDLINELTIIINENDEQKILRGNNFINSLSDDEHFNGFINSKIKIFSHKDDKTKLISVSLLGENLNIKKLLNHQTDDIKHIIWVYLHVLYYNLEILKESKNESRIKELEILINKNYNNNDTKNFLNLDVNNNTNSLINDIISSFEDSLKTSDNLSNPFNNILNISKTISDKYSDDIVNGNIEFDKLLGSITNKLPGMENLMKNFTSMNSNSNKSKVNDEKIIIDENFSTAIVNVGENKDEQSTFKISSILKMADKFGFIPDKNNDNNNDNNINIDDINLNNMLGKDLDISKLSGILQKMYTAKTNDEAEEIKTEMNSFLINDIGIDFNKLAQQLSDIKIDTVTNEPDKIKIDELVNNIINQNNESKDNELVNNIINQNECEGDEYTKS